MILSLSAGERGCYTPFRTVLLRSQLGSCWIDKLICSRKSETSVAAVNILNFICCRVRSVSVVAVIICTTRSGPVWYLAAIPYGSQLALGSRVIVGPHPFREVPPMHPNVCVACF